MIGIFVYGTLRGRPGQRHPMEPALAEGGRVVQGCLAAGKIFHVTSDPRPVYPVAKLAGSYQPGDPLVVGDYVEVNTNSSFWSYLSQMEAGAGYELAQAVVMLPKRGTFEVSALGAAGWHYVRSPLGEQILSGDWFQYVDSWQESCPEI